MHSSPPAQKRLHTLPLSPVRSGNNVSTSTTSSKETIEPITPVETDEQSIDRLWQQVRSKAKGSVDIPIPAEEGKERTKTVAEEGVTKVPKPTVPRLSRRASLTFRDSPDGRSTLAILNLPGVQKSDVHVSFQHKRLIVSYKSVEETEKWELDKVIQETKERRCVRAIPLPESIRYTTLPVRMENGDSVPADHAKADSTSHFVRITSGGKIKLWVEFCLKFLRDNPGKALTLHTLPGNPSPTGIPVAVTCTNTAEPCTERVEDPSQEHGSSAAASNKATKATCASARNIPRLISVVEIIKREYFKTIAPGPQSTGLYQYNHLGILEECVVNSDSESMDEDFRQRGIAAALEGRNFLRQEKTPYMKITLCTSALPALEVQTTCQYPSAKKVSRSARARQKRRLLKDSEKQVQLEDA